jgi:ABC-type sugar transport system ATPase subunit
LQENDYIIELRGITKTFPGVVALDNVDLKVRKGTVHAVVGENGAGKSTLMNVLHGIYRPDSGTVIYKNEERHFKGPNDALNAGIAMIHQELSVAVDLSVSENIFLGKEITAGRSNLLRKKEMNKVTMELFQELELDINPAVKMKYLSIAKQQMCEIAKAISYHADVIIMDEPTSAIMESEVAHLFRIIRNLIQKGISVIYISHKLDEIFEISDEISVYRDGRFIDALVTKETQRGRLIELMVGREIKDLFPKEAAQIGETILKVENLTRKGEFEGISFELRRGEILGVAGLMGAGRSEIMETLFGIRKKTSGEIYVRGQKVEIRNPSDAIRQKIALLTEDRKSSGCFLPLSVRVNTVIAAIQKYGNGIFINKKKTYDIAQEMRDVLSIKTPSLDQKIMHLSGGNQQKVLVGRWLLTEPDILIVDEPTRGIDVGSKSEIHKLISQLVQQGKAVIMISSELPEILGMSDRIMVISSGKLAGFIDAKEATQERVLLYATGQVS